MMMKRSLGYVGFLVVILVSVFIASPPVVTRYYDAKVAKKETVAAITTVTTMPMGNGRDDVQAQGIDEAARRGTEWKAIQSEAGEHGIICYADARRRELCRELLVQIRSHEPFRLLLKTAEQIGLNVYVESYRDVSWLSRINLDPTYGAEKNVELLTDALQRLGAFQSDLKDAALLFGFRCLMARADVCHELLEKVRSHEELASLIWYARHTKQVIVDEYGKFQIGIGIIAIDGEAPVEKIIKFLKTGT